MTIAKTLKKIKRKYHSTNFFQDFFCAIFVFYFSFSWSLYMFKYCQFSEQGCTQNLNKKNEINKIDQNVKSKIHFYGRPLNLSTCADSSTISKQLPKGIFLFGEE